MSSLRQVPCLSTLHQRASHAQQAVQLHLRAGMARVCSPGRRQRSSGGRLHAWQVLRGERGVGLPLRRYVPAELAVVSVSGCIKQDAFITCRAASNP